MLKLHPCFLPAKSKKKIIIIREKRKREKTLSECLNADKHSDNALQNRANDKKSEVKQV